MGLTLQLELWKWAIGDGQEVSPKDGPKICYNNLTLHEGNIFLISMIWRPVHEGQPLDDFTD